MPHYYDSGNRLSMDPCALVNREQGNVSVTNYMLDPLRAPACTDAKTKINAFAAQHPNLRMRDGFSAQGCMIDTDTRLRFSRGSQQGMPQGPLVTRTFVAVPNMARGLSRPVLESQIQQGVDTYLTDRVCDKYSERDLAHWIPLQNPCYFTTANFLPFPADSRYINKRHDLTVCPQGRAPRLQQQS